MFPAPAQHGRLLGKLCFPTVHLGPHSKGKWSPSVSHIYPLFHHTELSGSKTDGANKGVPPSTVHYLGGEMVSPKPQNQMPHSCLMHNICMCEQNFQFQANGCNLNTPKETRQETAINQAVR